MNQNGNGHHKSDKTDAEFKTLFARAIPRRVVPDDFADRLRERLHVELSHAQSGTNGSRVTRVHRHPAKNFRHVTVGFVAAAAAVLMMVFWPAPRAYSFETIRQQITKQAFVRARVDGDVPLVGWVAGGGELVAVESLDAVTFSRVDAMPVRFVRHDKQLEPIDDAARVDARLLMVLHSMQNNDADSLLVVQQESWKEVSTPHGDRIDLSVRFVPSSRVTESVPSLMDGRLNAIFRLDPDSGLPESVTIDAGNQSASAANVIFRYPTGGPTELTSLGVPRGVISGANAAPSVSELAALPTKLPEDLSDAMQLAPDAVNRRRLDLDTESKDDEDGGTSRRNPALTSLGNSKAKRSRELIDSGRRWPAPPVVDVPADWQLMSHRIDERFATLWRDANVNPAGEADAYELGRRIYLDLTGRIPRVSEVRDAVGDGQLDVARLMEQLIGSHDFSTHLATVWTRVLLPQDVDLDRFGGTKAFTTWLAGRIRRDTPYDQIVKELLLAEGRVGESGPVLFYTALEMKPDHLAKQTARALLGTRIDCAQCHDHPYDAWTQEDFWGYAALFARISRPQGKMEMISPVLRVRDTGVGEVMFPDTTTVVPPRLLGNDWLDEEPKSTKRRERLYEWLVDPSNRQFARATTNLLWSHFFGAGLVEPVDDFGPHNPAIADELIDELAEFFIASGYDLRSVVRAIVGSSLYRQTSRGEVGDVDVARTFHQMPIRWLTAEQLYDCLIIASGGLTAQPQGTDPNMALRRIGNVSRDEFVRQFRGNANSPLKYQAGIPQALALMNGPLAASASGETTAGLLQGLRAPFFTDDDRLETVFLALVGRPPSRSERAVLLPLLESSDDETKPVILSDAVWALINSAEFATNH